MALSFGSTGDNQSYPRPSFDGQEDQSYGFLDTRKVQTGTLRGTQIIAGTDGAKIVLGLIPNTTDFGIAFYDASGNLVKKFVGATGYVYNPTTGKNVWQDGKLPDSTYGFANAADGYNVSDGVS